MEPLLKVSGLKTEFKTPAGVVRAVDGVYITLYPGKTNPQNPPTGCTFHTRCPMVQDLCKATVPDWKEVSAGRFVSCHLYAGG